jgi:hypothetical protein
MSEPSAIGGATKRKRREDESDGEAEGTSKRIRTEESSDEEYFDGPQWTSTTKVTYTEEELQEIVYYGGDPPTPQAKQQLETRRSSVFSSLTQLLSPQRNNTGEGPVKPEPKQINFHITYPRGDMDSA